MRKRICVLEDNDDIREIISIILEDAHYEVFSFSTVESFTKRSYTILPDVFLLDVMLPDGNGLDVCNSLKSTTSTKNIPVVMMSANYSARDIRCNCKAEDFIPKPFDIDDFVARVAVQAKA